MHSSYFRSNFCPLLNDFRRFQALVDGLVRISTCLYSSAYENIYYTVVHSSIHLASLGTLFTETNSRQRVAPSARDSAKPGSAFFSSSSCKRVWMCHSKRSPLSSSLRFASSAFR